VANVPIGDMMFTSFNMTHDATSLKIIMCKRLKYLWWGKKAFSIVIFYANYGFKVAETGR
jgi:hypothetical protein